MKRLLLSALALFAVAFSAEAQDKKNAIGIRLSENDGFGPEVSYQRWLDNDNRLEFDLGWRDTRHYDAVKLVGLYQWVWNIEGGFNWYAGVGGGLGIWEHNNYYYDYPPYDRRDESGAFGVVTGDIGIEYNFPFPLQLFVDFRPELYFGEDFRDDRFGPDIGLGARFRF